MAVNSNNRISSILRRLAIAIGAGLAMACALAESTVRPGLDNQATSVDDASSQGGTEATGIENVVLATAQILAMNRTGNEWAPIWSGSGSVISSDGLVLTNNHVVDRRMSEYDALGVALAERSDRPPELAFLAQVVAQDPVLDLALIRISTDLNGGPVTREFPYVELGDSDQLEIGDSLRILGYPGIGGVTITLTEGAVSGFTLERGIEGRAWIKTDATIAGGNSGGMGIDAEGQLVGVPTIVSSGSDAGQTVDCRPLADTNRDGNIDETDNCVPVGGFINALRPVKLALPLIEAAKQGRQYVGGTPMEAGAGFDILGARFTNLVFSDAVTEDDRPTQLWLSLPTSSTRICAFWDYHGMADGLSWSSFWFINGELDDGSSITGQTWGGGMNGNWWVCIFNEVGLGHGVYELVLEVEGRIFATDSVFVGGDRIAVEFKLINNTTSTVCAVDLAPTLAKNWGQNDLDLNEKIEPGDSYVFQLASGEYDLRVLDCEGIAMLEEFKIELAEDFELNLAK